MEMADKIREEYIQRINCLRAQLCAAGPIHRKDLNRCIQRMERELFDYDCFHRGGDSNGKREKPASVYEQPKP